MKILKISLIFSFLIIFSSSFIKAQVTADFSANPTSGCGVPLIIQFTDNSTGSITDWDWVFGDGGTSTEQNPAYTYTSTGSFTITLTVSDGTNSDNFSLTITVFALPIAHFSTNPVPIGCRPFTLNFQDLSVVGDASITQWTWSFGDGGTSTEQNPVYTYTLTDNYTVSLQVVDANGCESVMNIIVDYVHVKDPPVVDFTANQTFSCEPPLFVQFTNNSTGNGSLTYFWDFGDSNTSVLKNPSNQYDDFGTYDVQLIVTDQYECTSDTIKPGFISITNITASFTIAQDTICPGELAFFYNTSGIVASCYWDFGDSYFASGYNQAHAYAAPSEYIVTLIAASGSECADTITHIIVIEEVIADFSSPNYGCELPFSVQYTDQSTNAVTWEWHFGNKNTSFEQNPINIFNSAGVYSDTLIVTSFHGCIDTLVLDSNITIIIPVIIFNPDSIINIPAIIITANPVRGCIPLDVNFIDENTYDNPDDWVVGWYWDFGDGDTSVLQNPTHIFNFDGDYNLILTITTSLGCEATDTLLIEAGDTSIVDFTASTDTSCAFDAVQFTDLSFDTAKVDEWFWNFDGVGSSNQQNPSYQFSDTVGYMDVTLIAGYNGCYDIITKDSIVYILGPIARFSNNFDCDSPYVYNFINQSIDAQYWGYDFGDSFIIDSITDDITTHTYDTTGNFTVTFTAYNDTTGCFFETSALVRVRDIKADFTVSDSTPCSYDLVNFDASGSQDAVNIYNNYYWASVDTGGFITPIDIGVSVSYIFGTIGEFDVCLAVRDINYCWDTICKPIKAFRPIVNFSADTLIGCIPFDVQFTDLTVDDTALISWYWNFGDGSFSTDADPAHTYTQINNNITVSLVVTDTLGCIGSLTKFYYIIATKPSPDFAISDLTICTGDSVLFVNYTPDASLLDFKWHFGDGDSSDVTNVWHTYLSQGYFYITLIATDTLGCDSAITHTDYIHVQAYPVVDFTADIDALRLNEITISDCYPQIFYFSDSTVSDYMNSWEWDFGDEQQSFVFQDPAHLYNMPGIYDVSLIVTTTYGCSDTLIKPQYIEVGGAYAEFSLLPDSACKWDEITFTLDTTMNVYEIIWDFGDGDTSSVLNPVHSYSQMGTLYPKLVYYSDSAETCKKYAKDSVYIHILTAGFSGGEEGNGCVPFDVYFIDQTISDCALLGWQWDFGDSTYSTVPDPIHTFTDTVFSNIRLIVLNEAGCKDTLIRTLDLICEPTIDVPTMFSPNGDGNNDIVYVRGWGIKKLLEFKIYNRWGQLIFETDDINIGWDGTSFNGEPQNIETYVYIVRAEDYYGKVLSIKGYISLIR